VLHPHLDSNYADDITMNFGDAQRHLPNSDHTRLMKLYHSSCHSLFSGTPHRARRFFTSGPCSPWWTPIQASIHIPDEHGLPVQPALSEQHTAHESQTPAAAFCGRGADKPIITSRSLLSQEGG